MSKPLDTLDLAALTLDRGGSQDTEGLFASPSTKSQQTSGQTPQSAAPFAHKQSHDRVPSKQEDAAERDARLRAELEQLRAVNRTIEGVTASLAKAKANMATVDKTVNSASNLLTTWTRILSQTEHNQRLILNPDWQGASRDLEDIGNDELRAQQEADRKAQEDQRRHEEAARRAEEEERRKAAVSAAASNRPGSGVGRRGSIKSVRGTRASQMRAGHAAAQSSRGRGTGASTSASVVRGSGIGRGTSAGTRGRGRGVG
ncbi:hypothetical protein K431DRAFT_281480 [Polychaeton citri CBS 116435]|uniref:DASH complex subunit DUO1 n=1 Tax=Polychaeton citri CBS 116435 TaxID=1314669 RepID=A0A9P4QEL4_9PEZI|nr:hypothetical protein K431DRAFT_281480 [Polychaeton citri CBS 116435]